MQYVYVALCIVLAGFSRGGLSLSIAADSHDGQEQSPPETARGGQQQKGAEQELPSRDNQTTTGFPEDELMASITVVYVRGANACFPESHAGEGNGALPLAILAPANWIGRTLHEQPSLHWYLPSLTPCPIVFTVIDGRPGKPLLEVTLPPPRSPGVQRVRLADYGLRLSPGGRYQWSISLVPDLNDRSKDLTVSGIIERGTPSAPHDAQLAHADEAAFPTRAAEAGLWYDALTALSERIEAAPADPAPRQQRAALLEQVEELRGIGAQERAANLTRER
jgi:hypothetical protein